MRNKRDVPAMWDLFENPRNPRADSPSTVDEEGSQCGPPPLSRRASFSSVTSEGSEYIMEGGGSWPRIRKQRTGESHSMSLFDVAEALEQQHLDARHEASPVKSCASAQSSPFGGGGAMDDEMCNLPSAMDDDMCNLAALVAEEEAASEEAGANVSVESFVEAVFRGIQPSALAATPTELPPSSHQTPPPQPPAMPGRKARAPTANELALLEAIAADEAAAAAEAAAQAAAAHAQAAKAKAKAAAANALAQHQQYGRASPAAVGTPAAASSSSPSSPAAPSAPAPADITSEELFAMLQMELPSPAAAAAPAPTLNRYSSLDEAECEPPVTDDHAAAAAAARVSTWPRHMSYGSYGDDGSPEGATDPAHALDASPDDFGAEDLQLCDLDDLDTEQLARRLEHTMGVPLSDALAEHDLGYASDWHAVLPPDAPPGFGQVPPHNHHHHHAGNHGHGASGGIQPPHAAAAPFASQPLPPPGHHLGQVLAPVPPLRAPAPLPVAPAAPASNNSKPARNGAERKEWTEAEDAIIRNSVVEHGCRWRRIAALLPGRSDDAVRNRWNRLKEMENPTPKTDDEAAAAANAFAFGEAGAADGLAPGCMSIAAGAAMNAGGASACAPPAPSAPPPAAARRGSDGAKPDREKPERVSWTKAEDETILRSVAELGHKWNRIAERLPGRTDHAIRNRFHRLQTLLEDRQRQQQRVLAPTQPLDIAAGLPTGHKASPFGDAPLADCSDGFDTPSGGGSGGVVTPGSR